MEPIPAKMKFIMFFIIGSMLVMFVDGLFFDNYNSRPSMAMMHMEMRPTMVLDPAPPSLEEYFAQFQLYPDRMADVNRPMEPQIIQENGETIKLYHITTQNVLHEIRVGVKVPMISFNNQVPAPTIRVDEGDHVRVILYNNATDPHTIHWHGVETLTPENDGVPDVNQEWVKPGETYTYDFNAGPAGTKMYHCHVEAPHHITMGMFGALIIDPVQEDPCTSLGGTSSSCLSPLPPLVDIIDGSPYNKPADVDNVFIFTEYDAKHKHVPMPGEMMAMGPDSILPWLSPSPKFMMPFDPSLDEFMVNGKAFPASAPTVLKQGQIVRWRLINLGLNVHSIHIHGHHFTVTHRDGFKLPAAFEADTLLLGPGERYDVWFKADNPGIWMVHDHAGMNAMAKGFDPAGIMWVIKYEGVTNKAYEEFLKRVQVYDDTIKHMDEEHGMLTPSGGGGMMDMEGMEGMGGDGDH